MPEQRNSTKSLLMMAASMLIFGTIGIFRKYVPLSSALLACCRGILGALFLLLLAALRKKQGLFSGIGRKHLLLLLLSGGMIGLNWILLFEAYRYTTVSTATLCYYMQPTIVALLSPLVFREKLTVKKVICILAALVGMALISGIPESGLPGPQEAKGILLGLGAAVLYAGVVMLNKKLPGMDAYAKTILQLGAAAVAVLPYVLATEDLSALQLTPMMLFMLLIMGILHTGIAYALYFASMDGLKAQTIALVSYLDPISALVLAALILHEPMTRAGILGAVLILGAALIGEWPARPKRHSSEE